MHARGGSSGHGAEDESWNDTGSVVPGMNTNHWKETNGLRSKDHAQDPKPQQPTQKHNKERETRTHIRDSKSNQKKYKR